MTGHIINTQQSQEFLSTMHTMIDDLDTISSHIDEVIYLRLVNGLQRLYNIHNTGTQTSSPNYETINRTNIQTNNEENNIAQNISSALIRHYELVNGIHINAYPVNSDNANNQNNHSMHWIEAALREGITRA
jgi:hypothetical protein